MDRTVTQSRSGGLIEDAGLLLLLVFMLPVAILAIGTPIALAVRVVIEIARRVVH
jgi:hypothetical protein